MDTDYCRNPEIFFMEMTALDVPEVAVLEQQIFSEPWSEAGFLSELNQSYALYLTAKNKENFRLVGYCGMLQSQEEANIVNVAVQKEFRGRGIAFAMLKELMERGSKRGVKRYTLEVRKSNRPALCLYEKLGFHRTGVRANFYEKPVEDAIILWT